MQYYKLIKDGETVGVATYKNTSYKYVEISEKEYNEYNQQKEYELKKQEKREEILTQLKAIDEKSIRALRANEQDRLDELEAQAILLRKELQKL